MSCTWDPCCVFFPGPGRHVSIDCFCHFCGGQSAPSYREENQERFTMVKREGRLHLDFHIVSACCLRTGIKFSLLCERNENAPYTKIG